jgi:excisionase family DNA binding protein
MRMDAKLKNPGSLLRPAEVASLLDVSLSQVYRWIRSGQLGAFRLGERGGLRVPAVLLERFLAPRTVATAEKITARAALAARRPA